MFDRPNGLRDEPRVYINKLFNEIQKCRVDVDIIKYRNPPYPLDLDTVKVAEALAKDLRTLYESNHKEEIE